ncbi:hypothetical protein [Streptomyces umbrinus]|uniref:hypothetical protein n=1 Tax=Streptomyces umbrinus TaxID=67370 RepID=UPI001BC9A1F8|nr:hypothetical protein [Streptomyces umbrinus]
MGDRAVAARLKDGRAALDTPQTPFGTEDIDIPAALRAGTSVRRHITKIHHTEADRFDLLAANFRILLEGGLTTP